MKKYLIGLGLVISAYALYLIQETLIILAYVAFGALALFLFTAFFIGCWYVFERMMTIRASRIERQKQSEVMLIDTSDGTFVRDINRHAYYRALHLQQTVYSDAVPTTDTEIQAWQIFNSPKAISEKSVELLSETISPVVLPKITERLKSSHQILISGITGSGKSTLCKHLLTWLVSQGYSIIPCDIHSPGTVLGFDVIGSGRKFNDIFNALEIVTETMHNRYNHKDYGKSDFNPKPIAIFMDELTTLVKEAKKTGFDLSDVLETLLVEGRKVNIKMILSIHSLDVKTLGLTAGIRENNTMVQLHGGEGSSFKCYVVPPLASIRSLKNWIEHSHPGPFNDDLQPSKFITKLPDAKTIKIKNLSEQGFRPTAIAFHINNVKKPNGRQINEVKAILNHTT